MTLAQYLEITGMTHKAYASALGVTRQMVGRWIKRGALVDGNGWIYIKYVKRNNKGD